MSIWCSWRTIGHSEFWADDPETGEVRSYATGWSNHYPTSDGQVEQPANVEIAHTPVWCVPGHADDFDDDVVGPWLRLSVDSHEHLFATGLPTGERLIADVVLDVTAVKALAADLTAWLERPKAYPVDAPVGVIESRKEK